MSGRDKADLNVDADGLSELSALLHSTAEDAREQGRRVVAKGSLNIKQDWRERWKGHPYIKALPFSITYDTQLTATGASGEIGPERGKRQAPLANLIEYGSVNNEPLPGGKPALEAEEPRFRKALEDLADPLEGR
jgi:hypothetical protein